MFLVLGMSLLPATALGVAFEEHSSWQKEPWLETEKGVSLGMSVLEMGTGYRFLLSDTFFNSNMNLPDESSMAMKNEIVIHTWDLFWRFGFTENWTLWGNIPLVWSTWNIKERPLDDDDRPVYTEPWNTRERSSSEGKLGDCETGLLYQFFRRNDPTISMAASLRWKLPTGSEVPGQNNLNITGTGTTDIELAYIGRLQLFRYAALGWSTGYNIRFPGPVMYILDRHSQITNAWLDLGDEIHVELNLIGAIEYVALNLAFRFTYRFSSALAVPEFRAETIRWTDPVTGEEMDEEYLLYNGAKYKDWDVRSPTDRLVSSAGYIFTITPRIIVRPLDWLDVTLFARIHLMGKNSTYLVDKDRNNSTIDNFMPMQALGTNLGGMVLGETGLATTVRW